ncbi:PREDICTED: uncharacterized protein LOC104824954 [Tarenaya hassleriana]|uniref:uncharacterized protein LOC104824954 n=1 Tax=Tarenaya hassleriana TaxID=28532 RepID=UPI00053C2481|nr:PREDICTED: uncharacterized protein LOC104824954 [Tarenaya hassleriana]
MHWAVKDAYLKYKKDNRDVNCLMRGTMTPDLIKQFDGLGAWLMMDQLKLMFEEKARSERFKMHKELAVDMVLHSLPDSFRHFVLNYDMNGMDKSLTELHGMLVLAEQKIKTEKSILAMQTERVPVSDHEERERARNRQRRKKLPCCRSPNPTRENATTATRLDTGVGTEISTWRI